MARPHYPQNPFSIRFTFNFHFSSDAGYKGFNELISNTALIVIMIIRVNAK